MLLAAVAGLAVVAPGAQAQVQAFGEVPCAPNGTVRYCEGSVATRVDTFDGVPLDVNVTLPAAPATGDGGPYPLIVQLHGYGGSKVGIESTSLGPSPRSLAEDGYAVLSYTARGFGQSCGSESSRLADPEGCARGWIHLADSRYEVRDTQHLAGLLADQGLVAPKQVGVTGVSYGGGQSVQLATLRDRIRLRDGRYVPWRSPEERLPMEIAAAVPVIPWTDLIYSLAPNGRTIDYLLTDENDDFTPVGVLKESFVAGLYASGEASGYYAPPGVDGDADLTNWFARVNAGEPYNGDPYVANIVNELTRNHSAYYLKMDRPPAPILISNGFTDDLFPVDEALRYANKVRDLYPGATLSQLHFDFGHQRGANKPDDVAHLRDRTRDWFDRYVTGDESAPALEGVEVRTQTCPEAAPSEQFQAPTFRELHPGEVRLQEAGAKTILSEAGDPTISAQFDPVANGIQAGSDPCTTTSKTADQQGTATYRLPVGDGFTLLGAPTVIANLNVTGAPARDTQIAARLWDVAPDNSSQRLIARALYRPTGDGRRVFQLHPNGYEFEAGHTVKLELLGNDAPYGRKSNPSFSIKVSKLDFRIPVAEEPGAGQVRQPAALFVPKGARLAPEYRSPEPPPPPPPPTPTAQCEGRKATIVGTHAGEEIVGTERRDVVVARGGNDVVRARGGKDLVCAGGDDDTVRGGAGDDRLLGATGADKLYGNAGDDTLKGGRGPDTLRGGRGSDRLRGGAGRDDARGGPGRDDVRD